MLACLKKYLFMVIIQVEGGLGNQMFQYALYCSFAEKGVKAKLDISKFNNDSLHNGYELEKIFGLNASYSSKTERGIVKSVSKILHVLFKHPYKEKQDWQWMYYKEVNEIKFGFLKGYWQSEKYFSGIQDTIREKFTFPVLQDDRNKVTLEKINNSNSVSVHIRRGDYITDGRSCSLGMDYYINAIALMNEKITEPVYFIFSDDMQWVKENIKESRVYFIDWNKGKDSYIDMQLMSCCKHNIIANSSFSWWGAWLNKNPGKQVITPNKWMPQLEPGADIIPGDWVALNNSF